MKRIDMIGKTFGSLAAIAEAGSCLHPNGKRSLMYPCKCTCGNQKVISGEHLRSGHASSCRSCNRIEPAGDALKCIVHDGRSFLFDKQDRLLINQHTWSIDNNGYAATWNGTKKMRLHKLLFPEALIVDHINGNALDNRRCSLRLCNLQENAQNSTMKRTNQVGYKGVYLHKQSGLYAARIHKAGKTTSLGYFTTAEEAASRYNDAASQLFGQYARFNIIGDPYATVSALHMGKAEEEGNAGTKE